MLNGYLMLSLEFDWVSEPYAVLDSESSACWLSRRSIPVSLRKRVNPNAIAELLCAVARNFTDTISSSPIRSSFSRLESLVALPDTIVTCTQPSSRRRRRSRGLELSRALARDAVAPENDGPRIRISPPLDPCRRIQPLTKSIA